MATSTIAKRCSACRGVHHGSAVRFHNFRLRSWRPVTRYTSHPVAAMDGDQESARQDRDTLVVAVSTAVFTGLGMFAINLAPDQLQEAISSVLLQNDLLGGFGIGDLAGGVMWSIGLYLCSPIQYLLLFFGRFDTERPADWVLQKLGSLTGQRVDEVDYEAPWWLQLPTLVFFAACGFSTMAVLSTSLGDSTWSVATGLGSLVGAAMYEVGRPKRLSRDEAQTLERQFQDFVVFANKRLQRSGQCHEAEVLNAFRRDYSKYRVPGVLSNQDLRSMIRNWHPDVRRSTTGYYKNLSLKAYVDPFTGERSGMETVHAVQATNRVVGEQPDTQQQQAGVQQAVLPGSDN